MLYYMPIQGTHKQGNRMAGRKGGRATNKAPATKLENLPEKDGFLSPVAIKVLFDYQKHFDLERAFDDAGVVKAERDAFNENARFRKELMDCRQWAEYGVRWGSEAGIARHLETYEELKEMVRSGDGRVAGPLVNLIKIELEAHGLMRKEDVSKTPVVNIQFSMQGEDSGRGQGAKPTVTISGDGTNG